MNKKLLASLLTLGLVLSPGAGFVNESLATETSKEENKIEQISDPLVLLRAYVDEFETTKKTEAYRLASGEVRNNIDKLMAEAKAFIDQTNPDMGKAREYKDDIDKANNELVNSAKVNLETLKRNIIISEKFLNNNSKDGKSGEVQKLYDDLSARVDISKKALQEKNIVRFNGDNLIDQAKSIQDLFDKAKAPNAYDYKEEYKPTDDDIAKLDEEIKEAGKEITNQDLKDLAADINAMVKDYDTFTKDITFGAASDDKKQAYQTAYDKLKTYGEINNENYLDAKNALKALVDARKKIDATTPNLNTGKEAEKDTSNQIIEAIKKLGGFVKEKDEVLKNLKDKSLAKSYEEKIALAITYCTNHASGIRRDLETYNKLLKEIEDLKAKINKSKAGEEAIERYNIDELERYKKFGESLKKTDSYKKSSTSKQIRLDDAIKEAEKIIKRYKDNPKGVTSDEISKAKYRLTEVFKEFDYSINDYTDKKSAREAMKKLLDSTAYLKLDQIYGKDEKEAKDAYTKARAKAADLVNDYSKASLDDMNKAYKDFNDSVTKLAEFLTKRLKKLVDDNYYFKSSKKYKDAEVDYKMNGAIANYLSLIAESEKELNKSVPDANVLNILYKKLVDARSEINGDITSQARKLSAAILDFDDFKNSADFATAANGLKGNLSEASKLYPKYIAIAENIKKANKLDSEEAKDILDLIEHTRDFIEGKITEDKYLANKYYHTLKIIKNHKDYKNINQASRIRLEKALKLYEEEGDGPTTLKTLKEVMNDEAIKKFNDKIEIETNPNYTRDKLLTDLNELINDDKKLKEGSFKYQKAQKVLRDAYDLALKEAKDFIENNKKPTEAEVRAVYNKLLDAKNKLDGDKFEKLTFDLAARFKKDQLKIGNPEARKAIAAKINALGQDDKTMDDALKVEKELNDLINPKAVTTTTLAPNGGVKTSTSPISTVTNPGSIVKTGIRGMSKVAGILVVAAGILVFIRKKGDRK